MTGDREEEIRMMVVNLDESRPFTDTADAPRIWDEFRAMQCEIKELDVRDMDEQALLGALGVLYGFPEAYEPNWGSGSGGQRRVVNLYIGDWDQVRG